MIFFNKLKKMNKNVSVIVFLLFCIYTSVYSQTSTKIVTIPSEIIRDKIRGGMLGQLLGNINGLKYEMKFIKEPGNVTNYIPSLPNGAYTDDDTDFEWIYIYEMQKKRTLSLPYDSIYTFWKQRINRRMWCSNRYVRHLMDMGIKPPFTGYISLNPWAEFNISGQFLCETFGLIAPAMPQTAAKTALNFTRVAIDQEPAQNTQLFTAMISSAFVDTDINKILNAGIAALDPKSKTLLIINDIRKWVAQNPENWRETRRLIRDKYIQENYGERDRNGYELNTGSIIAALLYGKGDFQETMKLVFNFGWDADNTAATTGTILGVMKGYKWFLSQDWQIVDRYRNETRDFMPMDETITSFCDRLIAVFEMINENNGGKKFIQNNTEVFEIVSEQAKPVILLQTIS
jgi:ADP-ribosylglycohydrolase